VSAIREEDVVNRHTVREKRRERRCRIENG